jgi:hypothetical protein
VTDPDFPPEDNPQPPAFVDQAVVELHKRVNLTQLADELREALGTAVQVAQLGPDERPLDPPSEDNPARLALSPSDVDTDRVAEVIEAHEPDEAYDVPKAEQEFTAVLQKVVDDDGSTLDDDETQAALRGLLLREAARRAP